MRPSTATPDDAMQLMQGMGYVVKYGKQTLGYRPTASAASAFADQRDANAYKIVKSGNSVYLDEIDSSERKTPAEDIAIRISEEITGGSDSPISPLTKARAVMIMRSSGVPEDLAFEAFCIIYPSSSRTQFDRMFQSSPSKKIDTSDRQRFLEYAMVKGLEPVIECIFTGNMVECANKAVECNLTPTSFKNLVEKAEEFGVIDSKKASKIILDVAPKIAKLILEKSVGDDVFEIINSDPIIKRMADSGNSEGIAERLSSARGLDSESAYEIASEIVTSYSMQKRLSR